MSCPDQYAGLQVRCPKCDSVLQVPAIPTAELVADEEITEFQSTAAIFKSRSLLVSIVVGSVILVSIGGSAAFYFQELWRARNSITVTSNLPKVRDRYTPSVPISMELEIPPSRTNQFDSGKSFADSASEGSTGPLSTEDLIKTVKPSIVLLRVLSIAGEESVASGFFLGDEGHVVTNYHVIQGAESVSVETADGLSADSAGYIIADAERDLAVLQIDPAELNCISIAIGSRPVSEGEAVAAFGSPRGFKFTTTEGIVSSVRSGEEIRGILKTSAGTDIYKIMGYSTETDWIQTSAAISGGNSGGPLVNMRGELIGVNTWKHPDAENVNFATATSEIRQVFDSRGNEIHSFRKLPASVTPRFGG
ncbi:MAG: trypsin-like peptidase domain-containing protein [Planctomycetota bacterium]